MFKISSRAVGQCHRPTCTLQTRVETRRASCMIRGVPADVHVRSRGGVVERAHDSVVWPPKRASHRKVSGAALRALAVEPTYTRARRFVAIRAQRALRANETSASSMETAKDARLRRARAEPLGLEARGHLEYRCRLTCFPASRSRSAAPRPRLRGPRSAMQSGRLRV